MEGCLPQDALEAFVAGYFGVLEALLSCPVTTTLGPVQSAQPTLLGQVLARLPVVMQASIEGGGSATVLLTVRDALRIAAMVFGKEAARVADRLAENDLATLKELNGHAVRGGLARMLGEGAVVPAVETVLVSLGGASMMSRLTSATTPGSVVAMVHFAAPPDLEGDAAVFISGELMGGAATSAVEEGLESGPEASRLDMTAGDGTPDRRPDKPPYTILRSKKELRMTQDSNMTGRSPDTGGGPSNLDMILDIRLVVRARLGHIEMPIGEILSLGPGSIIEVGRTLDEPVDLLVNDKLIARGDVVVVDEKFGLRITEIVSPRERIESLR